MTYKWNLKRYQKNTQKTSKYINKNKADTYIEQTNDYQWWGQYSCLGLRGTNYYI